MTQHLTTTYKDLVEAADMLRQGGLVAFPTETVYGIGALMSDLVAIESLYRIKGRAYTKPFTAHLYSLEQVQEVAEAPSSLFYKLAEAFLPGPLTIVIKKTKQVPALAVAGGNTVGIRLPRHAVAEELLRLVGAPVMASSANVSKEAAATSKEEIPIQLIERLAAIIDGGVALHRIASTVIAIDEEDRVSLLREGALTKTVLEKVCPICYSPDL